MSEENRPTDPDPGADPAIPPPPPPPAAPVWPQQPAAPPAAYPQAPAGYPQPGYPAQPYAAAPRSSNDAVIALVLAILSWLMCPLVLAIIALPFAAKGKREIDSSNGWVTGEGMVTAAKVIAWINIILSLLGLALVVIVLLAAAVSSSR